MVSSVLVVGLGLTTAATHVVVAWLAAAAAARRTRPAGRAVEAAWALWSGAWVVWVVWAATADPGPRRLATGALTAAVAAAVRACSPHADDASARGSAPGWEERWSRSSKPDRVCRDCGDTGRHAGGLR